MSTKFNPLTEGQKTCELAINYTAGNDIVHDKKLVKYELLVLRAHLAMLEKQHLITKQDYEKIIPVLDEISALDKEGKFELKVELEDVHSNVEQYILSKVGMEAGGNVRLAIARNDQVYTDLRMYYKDKLSEISNGLKSIILELASLSKEHSGTIMPGYTHLRISQPITYGFFLSAKAYHFYDDLCNLDYDYKQIDKCPLGIFEMSGTHAPIDREFTSSALGFSKPTENSLYTANQRGEVEIKICSDLSLLALHIKRFMSELMLFSTHEFGFIEISSEYTTGGTAQPNLVNPDTLEVIRANCSKIMGTHSALLHIMDSLPSGYNRDTQETKGIMFEALEIMLPTLEILQGIAKSLKLNKQRMEQVAGLNFSNAPDYTIQLAMSSGLSFRESYKIIKHIISSKLISSSMDEIDSDMLNSVCEKLLGKKISVNMQDFDSVLGPRVALNRKSLGSSSPKEVMKMADELMEKVRA